MLNKTQRILFLLMIAVILVLSAALALLVVRLKRGKRKREGSPSRLAKIFLSDVLLGKSSSARIAYVGVMTALCVAVNMFELRFADVQFSFTVFMSVLTGILIGPAFGAAAVFLGDLIGYVVNSWGYLYMPWVGLSCAMMAFLGGLLMKIPLGFRGSGYLKLGIVCAAVLAVCSVGINTTGFYFYYTRVGFSGRALGLMEEHFGVNGYLAYALVRLVFMGQLWNNLFNFALLFVAVPVLNAVKPLKIKIR